MLYTLLSIYDVGGAVGVGTADLDTALYSVLRWFLGIISLIAVVGIIIGGTDYMISGGSDVVKERAKKIIYTSVVGLVVCILSWAAVFFIVGNAANASR